MSNIDVSIKLFPGLFDKKISLEIPEYQRPYTWGKDKTDDLLQDLEEHFLISKSTNDFYLGTILYFHNKVKSCYEIIDGQQRITTLLIIQSLLQNEPLAERFNIKYNSHQSVTCIKDAQSFFTNNYLLLQKLQQTDFLNRLNFTLIITHSEDEAFTFFDTQNNRGMKLSATDFLKAYHLRAVISEFLQEKCAIQWEKYSAKSFDGPFLSHLFDKILWRARNWRGQNYISFENRDEILYTFQKLSIKADQEDSYPLYPNFYNRQATGHVYKPTGELIRFLSMPEVNDYSEYPFSLRQPLFKGLNFFKYSEKYAAIHEVLFQKNDPIDDEIVKLRHFYNMVYEYDMSIYLRHFMQLCLIAYYDVFGKQNILRAALCFDYLIGSIRLQKQQVKKEAVTLCLKNHRNNLIDVITQAYLTEDVFNFVYNHEIIDKIYLEEDIGDDGVQGRYKRRILQYFNKTDRNLKNRKTWGKI